MHQLADIFITTIYEGLKKASVLSCSDWATKYRKMGKPFAGPFSFKWHPWTREMHDCNEEFIVGMKAAQLGYTEYALNRVFYYIDIKKIDCLYVLPSKTPDASNFSAARFDPALELSPYLNNLFSEVKNVGHKRAGNTNLYIRGGRSESGLKSVPAGLIVLDEVDEIPKRSIYLAEERQSGQTEKQTILISTPKIAKKGIHAFWENSTQQEFMFRCPSCSRIIMLEFPDSIIITADDLNDPRIKDTHLICKECKAVLPHETKYEWLADGRFVPAMSNGAYPGFHVNQLYSPTERPSDVAKLYLRAMREETAEQEFYNSKLGIPHEVKGARVNDTQIMNCLGAYLKDVKVKPGIITTMGVDQGRHLHVEIDAWDFYDSNSIDVNDSSRPRVVDELVLNDFEELDKLMRKYHIHACVIDAHPEKRKALEFANRFPGFVYLCYYGEGVSGRTLHEWHEEPAVTVDRTSWLDLSLGRIKNQLLSLPRNVSLEYQQHVKEPVRVYYPDNFGNSRSTYVTAENAPDHFAHARTYAEIALQFAAKIFSSYSIRSPR